MRTTNLLAVVLALLLVVPGPVLADVSGRPNVSVYAADQTLVPGEETSLELTLLNKGTVFSGSAENPALEDEVTTARGVEVELSAGDAPVSVRTGTRAVGTLPEGTSPPVPFTVVVDEDAEPGRYELPVRVRYVWTRFVEEPEERVDDEVLRRFEEGDTERLTVTIEIEERARFEVVGVESDLAVGQRGTVSVSVENVGTDLARDAYLTLQSGNPEVTLGGGQTAESYAGSWETGERRTFTVGAEVAPDAERRNYALKGVVTFEDRDGQDRESEPLRLGVTPRAETEFVARGVQADLRVGEEGTLRGTIVNTGESTARNAVVVFRTDQTTVNPVEREVAVGDLGPGQGEEFAFDVDVSEAAEGGSRQFSLVVRYRDGDGDVLESDPVDVPVTVEGKRDTFAVEPVEATFQPGSGGRLELRVTNQDDETLTDVSAKLFVDDPLTVSDDEAFVGSLESGETASVAFAIDVGGSAIEKDYPVSVDFQYEDADGDTLVSDAYRVPVTVQDRPRQGGLPLYAYGGAFVAIALLAIAGYVRFRR